MNSSQPQALFVYGTLKRGGSNHHWLEGAPWQGRARLPGHQLHSLGAYPMAVPGRGVVHGELYAVDGATLERLDRLEDVPNEYRRLVCRLADGRHGWVYLGSAGQVRRAPRVPYDDWESTPVFCYGSDLDPPRLRRRLPHWDGTAWLARLAGWRWQAAGDVLCQRGVAALLRPDPRAWCWGVVVHERRGAGQGPGRGGEGAAAGWRNVGLRLEPWHHDHFGAPVGAVARVWWPQPGQGAALPVPGPGPGPGAEEAQALRRGLVAGAVDHGLPAGWCRFLRDALAAAP